MDSSIERLRRKVRREIDLGNLEQALALCDQAITLADQIGDQELLDQAICNRGSILVVQGRGGEIVAELRKILLRSASATSSCQAAYVVSQFHELNGQRERSLFYARLALDHAMKSQHQELIAKGHNRIANLLMLDSYFDEACSHYREALRLLPSDFDLDHALLLSNLGYCQAVLGYYNQGIKSLFRSLERIRRWSPRPGPWERFPCLGLSYAYLELGKLEQARRFGLAALRHSESAGSVEQVKNALYLLGETEKMAGNEAEAYDHFERLQYEFFPDKPYVTDFLMSTDIRKLINLMA